MPCGFPPAPSISSSTRLGTSSSVGSKPSELVAAVSYCPSKTVPAALSSLVASLSSSLASKLKGGLSLKVGTGYDGARLVSNDGSGYIDLSAEEMAGLLKPYLSDAVKALVFD